MLALHEANRKKQTFLLRRNNYKMQELNFALLNNTSIKNFNTQMLRRHMRAYVYIINTDK